MGLLAGFGSSVCWELVVLCLYCLRSMIEVRVWYVCGAHVVAGVHFGAINFALGQLWIWITVWARTAGSQVSYGFDLDACSVWN
jgi:hypothetical protein